VLVCCSKSEQLTHNYVSLKNGPINFTIDTQHGGRIVNFSYNNKEILTKEIEGFDFHGSTFWPSPQSDWGWPPYQTLDSDPYEIIDKSDDQLYIQSKIEPKSKIQVKKYFAKSMIDSSIIIRYTMINHSTTEATKVAPWEVTRVANKGLLTFNSNERIDTAIYGSYHPSYCYDGILTTLDLNIARPKKDNFKIYGNGNGRINHLHDSLYFIKQYPDISINEFAPKETEIEVFVNDSFGYMEIEQQGPYTSVAPHDSLVWEVKWYLIPSKNFKRN
jgi:hypothetical protein